MTHTPSLSGPIFKFSRETNAVRVENIPQNVNRLEVLSLFSTLIGDIRTSQDANDALEITFFTGDSARKALCMNGYNVAGSSLRVMPIVRAASPTPSHCQQGRRTDVRRNLYVLGIPFGMTNQSLADTFAQYGCVSHSVILATLDSASRRRGFVVMSTHEEARQVMAALGRNSKGGGGMDISWAVVQRSKGFLDGGDRAGVVQPPAASLTATSVNHGNSPMPSLSMVPTSTLLLANLPSLLFGSEDDLRGLVCPFGSVKVSRIVTLPSRSSSTSPFLPISVSTPTPSTPITAAIVQYNTLAAAQEAHRALDGESYAGCTVRVTYLAEADAGPASAPDSPLPETPTFSPKLSFPPSFSAPFLQSSRCAPALQKVLHDDREIGNAAGYYGQSAGPYPGPDYIQHQQQLYSPSSFPAFNSYPVYGNGMYSGRSIPDSMYARAPSTRNMGYYV